MALQPLHKEAIFLSELYRKNKITRSEDDSDDEEWEEQEALINLMAKEFELRVKGKKFPQPRLANYVEKIIPKYKFERFRTNFRMMPATVDDLENVLSPILERQGLVGRIPIPPRKQILSVIWLLATPDSYRSVGEKFGMSKSTLHHCFQRVIHALCAMVKSQIYWPHGAEAEDVKRRFQRISGMPNVIGAIDGCQVEIDAPKEHPAAYRTGKKKYAMQLQAVCTSDLLLTDIFCGYPGSVHDSRVFKNSPLFRDASNIFQGEEYIIGDKAYYPVRTWCIPPYKNYGVLTQAEVIFNTKLSKTRQVIERCFCLLKGRFRRLKHLVMYRTDEISVAIMAACVLHNLCLRGLQDHPDHIEEYIRDGQQAVIQTEQEETETETYERSSVEAIYKRDCIKDLITN